MLRNVTIGPDPPRSVPDWLISQATGWHTAPLQPITMGIIADTFRDRINEMQRKDEESMAELIRILNKLKGIAKDMEQIELGSES